MDDIDLNKNEVDAEARRVLRRAARKTARNTALMVGVLAAGGSAGGGVLLGAALAGPFGAAAGGVIGAWAAYKAFRDAEAESRPATDTSENTDAPVGSH